LSNAKFNCDMSKHIMHSNFNACSALIDRLITVQRLKESRMPRMLSIVSVILTLSAISGCSQLENVFKSQDSGSQIGVPALEDESKQTTIWDALNSDLSQTPVKVNRYIWQAALEVLDFMPIETIDPFSGVIVMGYGVPPGGDKAYRATVYVSEPALDARTLRVAVATRAGATSPQTMRTLEDAILSRARQLRELDGQF
jgi:hypothetical protein